MKLNVLTYNIRGELWTPECSDKFAQLVRKHEVDIICLQEVVRVYNHHDKKLTKRDLVREIEEELDGDYTGITYLPVQSESHSVGTAIMYRKERVSAVGQEYAKAFPRISQRTRLEEWANKFMLPMRRLIMSEKFKFNTHRLIVYNVHMDYFGGDARRIYQLRYFFNLWGIGRYADNVIEIIAGDFNTWAPYKLRKMWEFISIFRRYLLNKGFRDVSRKVKWTQVFDKSEADEASEEGRLDISRFNRALLRYDRRLKQKLDHIWVRGDVDVISCERIDVDFSDHYPVLAELKLKERKNDKDR